MTLAKKIIIVVLSIFGSGALFASPAYAGVKVTGVTGRDAAYANALLANCYNYVFDTPENARQCVLAAAKKSANLYIKTETTSYNLRSYRDETDQCKTTNPSSVDMISAGKASDGSVYAGRINLYLTARARIVSGATGGGRLLFLDANCSSPFEQRTYAGEVTLANVSEPGDDGPDEVDGKPCRLNTQWASWGLPARAAGEEPPQFAKFRVAYVTETAYPAWKTDGNSQPALGHLMTVTMSPEHECQFRRDTRARISPDLSASGQTIHVYTLSYIPSDDGSKAEPGPGAGSEIDQIRVKQPRVSKPSIPYGELFNGGLIEKIEQLARMKLQAEGKICSGDCTTTDGQPIPVVVEARQTVPEVPYHHPAPQQLRRDNPDCSAQFDPRCAWAPSPTVPATQNTDPNTLIRISNSGDTIVRNSTTVYNNTIYPQPMRDAGTAPGNTAPGDPNPVPGTNENPDDPDSADGSGAELSQCIEDQACGKLDASSVRAYMESFGVDPDADRSSGTIADGILGKAMANGQCTSATAQNPFCQLAAGFSMLSMGEGGDGDFVAWRGNITIAGVEHPGEVVIPDTVMDLLETLLAIITAFSAFSIALRGRPL